MTTPYTMGLKLKRFRAKLNWKTKKTVPEVVCLRYQIHSEFQDPLGAAPSTSNKVITEITKNEVINSKKPISKPPIQSLFESNTTVTTNDKFDNDINNVVEKISTLKTNESSSKPSNLPAPPPKGILKKPTIEENISEEINSNKNLDILANAVSNEDADDLKKSALIFMTENHDYNEETSSQAEDKHRIKETLNELQSTPNIVSETTETNKSDEEIVELGNKNDQVVSIFNTQENETEQKSNREHKTSTTSNADSEQDVRTVRWRETIIEIKPNIQFDTDIKETNFIETEDNSTDDFKVHFVKHNQFSTKGLEDEESETESDDNDETDTPYYANTANRGAYSSQAASIFFAGEDPEPAPRVRDVPQDEDDANEIMKSKSS